MEKEFLHFERLDHCPACGNASIKTEVEPDVSQCSACQVYFRNPRPTQAEIARSYDTGGTFDAWQEEETSRAAMWERRVSLVRRFQARGRLLDVGTGDGHFLETARTTGFEVTGTEVSVAGASYARARGFDIHLGQVTDLALPSASFDVATIWHVLEHVPDPRAVLQKVHSLLRPGGTLVVAVPNEENYFIRRRFGMVKASPFASLQFGGEIHLTYFRPNTLRSALRTAGFDVLLLDVDDAYYVRDLKMRAKLLTQRLLARAFHWHFAVAMCAICRRT